MRNYEVTFIIDPVLSGDELKSTAQKYITYLEEHGASIVHIDEMGLRPLAYTINKRSSGIYYCIEFSMADGTEIDKFELNLRRNESILRFLTVSLDKFGVKYNADKRAGLIGKKTKPVTEETTTETPAPPAPKKVEAVVETVVAPVVQAQVAPIVETVDVPVVEEAAIDPELEGTAE
jgi:small subunit ribosomal protein S6